MSEEELTGLEEELAAARGEAERLQSTAADREARASHLEAQLAELRGELEESRRQAEAREEELRAEHETLASQINDAAQRYRELVLERSPELPEDLITGGTVAEIDQAIERAMETVSKVRGHLESQAQATRVPVGSPPRSAPDLSDLSAEAKIERGLKQRSA